MQFVLITRPDLEDTNELFRAACHARGLHCAEVVAGQASAALSDTDGTRLIYCAATDRSSRLVEKLLARTGDALLHDPHFICDHQPILLARTGIPMARAVYVPDPDALERQVTWLGGFPVVVKRPGTEGGQGVSLAGDLAELHAQLNVPEANGAVIETFIPHDLCWRLTVLAGRVLAANASKPPKNDFRSNVSGGYVVDDAVLPDEAAEIAIRAVATTRCDFGGVDLMQGTDGSLIVAEVNFPCYFADQQARLRTGIAGAIVDHLIEKVG